MEIGNEKENLILKTAGKLKVQWGKKFVDLLDKNGNLNVKQQQIIKSSDSIDNINSNGIYVVDGKVIIYYDENVIILSPEQKKEDAKINSDIKIIKDELDTLKSSVERYENLLFDIAEFLEKVFPIIEHPVKNSTEKIKSFGFYSPYYNSEYDSIEKTETVEEDATTSQDTPQYPLIGDA